MRLQGRAQRTFHETLTPSYITLSSGDIKDLPKTATDLNLQFCMKLTGKEGHAMAQGRANPIQLTDLHTCRRDHTSDGSMAFEHQAEEPVQLRQVRLDRRHEPALHHQGRPEQHEYPRRYLGVKISCARCPNASPSASHPSRKPTSLRSSLLLPLAYTQAISRYSGTCRSPS